MLCKYQYYCDFQICERICVRPFNEILEGGNSVIDNDKVDEYLENVQEK